MALLCAAPGYVELAPDLLEFRARTAEVLHITQNHFGTLITLEISITAYMLTLAAQQAAVSQHR